MIETRYYTRVYVDRQYPYVMVRIRWDHKETAISVGCKVDPTKWDTLQQRAVLKTIHKVDDQSVSAQFINAQIESCLEHIREAFAVFNLASKVPTVEELRNQIAQDAPSEKSKMVKKTIYEIFEEFMSVCSDERDWSEKIHYKYLEMWDQFIKADPNITLDTLTKERIIHFKNYLVSLGLRNVTIVKKIKNLKSFLRWAKGEGYEILPGVLEYKINLKVVPKTVTFLKLKELIAFQQFEFPAEKKYLAKARDLFCFMSYTSLRYSDLKALRKAAIFDDHIEVCTQKTSDVLNIPLVDPAKKLLEQFLSKSGDSDFVFRVPSNQKLNDYLKEAAQLAGLDREIVQTYFVGTMRHDESSKFYEQISCHDARRTFVCISLAMGIPATVVMSCTGHKDYKAMKPYIEVADETQKLYMSKWNTQTKTKELEQRLSQLSEEQIDALLKSVS